MAQQTQPKPTVAFIADTAQGREIMRADYQSAIDSLQETAAEGIYAFYAANNLCVSHLKLGELDDARDACETAVAQINELLGDERSQIRRVPPAERERFLAIALSNRGVVHAASGREALARADFEAAIEAHARTRQAKTNLAWLSARGVSGA